MFTLVHKRLLEQTVESSDGFRVVLEGSSKAVYSEGGRTICVTLYMTDTVIEYWIIEGFFEEAPNLGPVALEDRLRIGKNIVDTLAFLGMRCVFRDLIPKMDVGDGMEGMDRMDDAKETKDERGPFQIPNPKFQMDRRELVELVDGVGNMARDGSENRSKWPVGIFGVILVTFGLGSVGRESIVLPNAIGWIVLIIGAVCLLGALLWPRTRGER